jgi:CDP-diacylglycerol--glycerol-3-phosphate 3-phosphatidyltransferase
MKHLANLITVSRIILVLTLFLVEHLSFIFMAIYLFCGITDILDGYVARKTHTSSSLGARLDSIADLVMVMVVLFILVGVVSLPYITFFFIGAITLVRLISLTIVGIKYKTFGILHTYGNKVTGFILLFTPLLLGFVDVTILTYILGGLGLISALEELLIHIISDEIDLDRRSFLIK